MAMGNFAHGVFLMNMLSHQSEKAAEKSAKLDFDLHVSLIMRAEHCAKNRALFLAWLEGPAGLDLRLNPALVNPLVDDTENGQMTFEGTEPAEVVVQTRPDEKSPVKGK